MRALALAAARWDYLELAKPRLTTFVLIVVALSAWLAGGAGGVAPLLLFHAVFGTALVATGASALNMYIERDYDALMVRTQSRPLPSGRLQPREVLLFGVGASALGLLQLFWATTPLATLLAVATLGSYVGIYTPLKRRTTLNTHIGAISGALPALIGWAAVDGGLSSRAWSLFLVVYLWQIPHFLSIAWLYREDYARGGFRMLPIVDPEGVMTGRQAVLGALALLTVSLVPMVSGQAGLLYAATALVLGLFFLHRAAAFALARTTATARALLRASLVYLPPLFLALILDRVA